MIHAQSCHNMITIKSRTQGDNEELKIMLEKCLISSRFNQEFSLKEKSSRKIGAVQFPEGRLDGRDAFMLRTISGHVPMTRAHLLLMIRRLIFIGVST